MACCVKVGSATPCRVRPSRSDETAMGQHIGADLGCCSVLTSIRLVPGQSPHDPLRCGLNSTTSNTQRFVLNGAVRQFPQGFGTGVASRHLADAHVLPLRVPPSSVVPLCAALGWVAAQSCFQVAGVAHCVKVGSVTP